MLGDEFGVAGLPERPSTAPGDSWSDWAGLTSLLRTLTGEPKSPEEQLTIPRISVDDSVIFTPGSDLVSSHDPHPLLTASSIPSPYYYNNGDVETSSAGERGPFQKWISSLHRRASYRSRKAPHGLEGSFHGHAQSSSGSSFAFVSAVKSASLGLGSITTRTRSRPGTMHSRTRTDRSSRLSVAAPRFSEDSTYNGGFIVTTDKAALSRSIQRRSILEELIATEENYIGDVRFLINVCEPFYPIPLCVHAILTEE